jgi:hypothetical protein
MKESQVHPFGVKGVPLKIGGTRLCTRAQVDIWWSIRAKRGSMSVTH